MKTKTKVLDLNKSTREIRKIDSFEAAHFIFSEKNDCNISIILRLAHSISFSLLKKAVNEIKKRNFLLRCRVNIDPLSFQETEKSPEILFIEKNQERDWESVASYEAHKLFNYQEGPLFRICYLAGKTSNEVILSMHHSISDGATLIAVVSEIIKYTLNPKSKYKKDLKIDLLDKLSIEKSVLKELNKESVAKFKKKNCS